MKSQCDWRARNARKNFTKHGLSKTPTYNAWSRMRRRCNNPNSESFKHYGGRGITCCAKWNEFEEFLKDMGPKPGPAFTLERKNSNLGYSPENCVWATMKAQNRNRRNNRLLTARGQTRCLADWAEILGFPGARLWARLKLGWSIERTFNTPKLKNGY